MDQRPLQVYSELTEGLLSSTWILLDLCL